MARRGVSRRSTRPRTRPEMDQVDPCVQQLIDQMQEKIAAGDLASKFLLNKQVPWILSFHTPRWCNHSSLHALERVRSRHLSRPQRTPLTFVAFAKVVLVTLNAAV